MRTKLGILSLTVLVALLALLLAPLAVYAQESVMVPHPAIFFGTIEANGKAAPVGTVIVGKIADAVGTMEQVPLKTAEAGKYGTTGVGDGLIVQTNDPADIGKTIEFYIKLPKWKTAIAANETSVFDSGLYELNLTVTGPSTGGSGGSGGGGGGGGGGGSSSAGSNIPPVTTINTNLFGIASTLTISSGGAVQQDFKTASADGKMSLSIARGTIAKDAAGKPIASLSEAENSDPPAPPSDMSMLGTAFSFEPSGATFNPPAAFSYQYDPALLPEGVSETSLMLAFYDTQTAKWVDLKGTVDAASHTITAGLAHFSTLAVFHPAVAVITPSIKSITPAEAAPGDNVSIVIDVANTGDKEGTYAAVLMVNDTRGQEKSVLVAPGGNAELTFVVSKDQPGTYEVAVGEAKGSFTVKAPAEPSHSASPTPSGTAAEAAESPAVSPIETSPVAAAVSPEMIPAATSPAAEDVQPSSNMPLIIGIISVVVIAAALLLFLLPRRKKASH